MPVVRQPQRLHSASCQSSLAESAVEGFSAGEAPPSGGGRRPRGGLSLSDECLDVVAFESVEFGFGVSVA